MAGEELFASQKETDPYQQSSQNDQYNWRGKARATDDQGNTVAGTSGAEQDSAYYRQNAQGLAGASWNAQMRQGPQVDYSNASQARAAGWGSRMGQQTGTNLALMRALGYDSAAQRQAAIDSNRLYAQQQSAAASARGPAALAMAQQNAAATNAAGQSAISAQSQVAAAQERAAYTQQYNQAIAQQRAQDLQLQGLDAQQAQYQAMLEMQQRQANDQFTLGLQGLSLGHEKLGFDVNAQQLAANQEFQRIKLGYTNSERQAQAASDQNTADLIGKFSDVNSKAGIVRENPYGIDPVTPPPALAPSTADQQQIDFGERQRAAGMMQGAAPGMVGKFAGMGLMFSDERAKNAARKEGAQQLARVIGQQQMQAASPVPRQLPAPQQPAEQSPLIPGVGHLSRAIDARVDPEAQAKMQAAVGSGPLVPGVGHVSQAIDQAAAQPPAMVQPRQATATVTSDERAKADAHIQGMAHGLRMGMQAQGDAPGPMQSYAGLTRAMTPMERYSAQSQSGGVKEALDAAPAYTWNYKPGLGPEGRQAGPMAQDLAKTEIGRSMVRKDPQSGLLAIDPNAATRFNLAANSLNNQRLNQLEQQGNALARAMGAQGQAGPMEQYAKRGR